MLAVTILATVSTPIYAFTDAQSRQLARFLRTTPGIQYVVVDTASTLCELVGGWADLRSGKPMSAATTLMAYSMSKTITAAAVLLLYQQRKIELDIPITEYIGPLPYNRPITIRQLLAHTSGIPNPLPLRWVHGVHDHERFDEQAALNAVLAAHPKLSFIPGSKYSYSNIGYWILGRLVECVTRRQFTSYVKACVLEPVGASAEELGYVVAKPSDQAVGYLEKYSLMNLAKRLLIAPEFIGSYAGPWLEIGGHYVNGPGFGGLVGTARGFGKFLQDQLKPQSAIFKGSTRALFFEQQKTVQGKKIPMTLGWHVGASRAQSYLYKEGGGAGFRCLMRLYLGIGVASVVMTNSTGFSVHSFLDNLDSQFLKRLGSEI